MKTNVHYSPWKLWYIATLVRGMSIDEALKQIDYVKKKGASIVKETLLEAQELAVKEHHVEFRSNLWVGKSIIMYDNIDNLLCTYFLSIQTLHACFLYQCFFPLIIWICIFQRNHLSAKELS